MGLVEYDWFQGRTIVKDGMSLKHTDSGGQNGVMPSDPDKDVPRRFWTYGEPIRIVEGSCINAVRFRKTLETQIKFCSAGGAKMNIHFLVASRGA
jgi:hypothetical protein